MLTRSTKNATNFDGGMDVATGRIETDGQRTFPEFSNVSYARVCARARKATLSRNIRSILGAIRIARGDLSLNGESRLYGKGDRGCC
jgi:hypothetical protein